MEILRYIELFVDETENASHSGTGTGIYDASNSNRLQLYFDFRKPDVFENLFSDHSHEYSSVVDAIHTALSTEADCLLLI